MKDKSEGVEATPIQKSSPLTNMGPTSFVNEQNLLPFFAKGSVVQGRIFPRHMELHVCFFDNIQSPNQLELVNNHDLAPSIYIKYAQKNIIGASILMEAGHFVQTVADFIKTINNFVIPKMENYGIKPENRTKNYPELEQLKNSMEEFLSLTRGKHTND